MGTTGEVHTDYIRVNLRRNFFQVYFKLKKELFKMFGNHPFLICGQDFANKKCCSANLKFRTHI